MRTDRRVAAVLLLLSATLSTAAADPPANPARTTLAESVGAIEPLDLLRVTVHNLYGPGVATTRLARVDPDGNARLPLLGARKLVGLTTADAEAAAPNWYRESNMGHGVGPVTVARVEAGPRVKNLGGPAAKGDLLVVSINDLTSPGRTDHLTVRVDDAGAVSLPYVNAVAVAGLTEHAAADAVAKALRSMNILQNPDVAVRILEPAAASKVKPGPVATGDLLAVEVWDLTAPGNRTRVPVRVAPDGTARLPLIPAVKIAGLTEAKAAEAIAKRYADDGLLRNPIVLVRRTESADRATVKPGPIAKGDVLRLMIADLTGPGDEDLRTARFDDAGHVRVPFVGPVKLEGLAESAAADAIAKAYADQNIIRRATVWVLKVDGAAPVPDDLARDDDSPPPLPAEPPTRRSTKRR